MGALEAREPRVRGGAASGCPAVCMRRVRRVEGRADV